MKRGRATGESAADNGEISFRVAGKRRGLGVLAARRAPEVVALACFVRSQT
jgi:hypothetical protein